MRVCIWRGGEEEEEELWVEGEKSEMQYLTILFILEAPSITIPMVTDDEDPP